MEPYEQLYDSEPARPELLVASAEPFNGEPPLSRLVKHYVTPTELFFVRNHSAVPLLDATTHRVSLSGSGFLERELSFSVADLSNFEQHTVTCALQCAGNRRRELVAATGKAVKGLAWGSGACGNATWSGVWLRDVLLAAGLFHGQSTASDGSALSTELVARLHVAFEGADGVKEHNFKEGYGSSIPLSRCLAIDHTRSDGPDGLAGVLLATKMNGEPLTRDHGAPIRVVVPGVIGARSVKWLRKITVQSFESTNFYQQRDYKLFPPHVDWDTVEPLWSKVRPVQEMIVQSVVCAVRPLAAPPLSAILSPSSTTKDTHQKLPLGAQWVAASGYALSGGGRRIERVDVSGDGGTTWTTARLQRSSDEDFHETKGSSDGSSDSRDDSGGAKGNNNRLEGSSFGWTLWSVDAVVVVPHASNCHFSSSRNARSPANTASSTPRRTRQVVCRAWDDSGNTQPEHATWNLRGVMNNAWSRVDLLPTSQL